MRESYWDLQDEEVRLHSTPLANVTHGEFEALMERVLWRVLVRAAKAVRQYALMILVGLLMYVFLLRPLFIFILRKL